MLKKALVAAALTLGSGVALAHPPHRHYAPPVRYYYPVAPRVVYRPVYRPLYRPVPVYPVAPVVVPAPIVIPHPGIVVRLRFPL